MSALEPYCAGFLCTDVDREGTMRGVNLAWFRELRRSTRLPIVAAGGISTTRQIAAFKKSAWTPPSAWPSTKTASGDVFRLSTSGLYGVVGSLYLRLQFPLIIWHHASASNWRWVRIHVLRVCQALRNFSFDFRGFVQSQIQPNRI